MRLCASALAILTLSAAPAASAGTVPLSSLLGHSVDVAGVTLDFLAYTATGSAPAASAVEVVFPPPGSRVAGFTLDGAFGAPAGRSGDATLFVTATAAGRGIRGATLSGDPDALSGTGLAAATDSFHAGTSSVGPTLGTIAIASAAPPGPGPVSVAFSPRAAVTLVEDISAVGGSHGVSTSSIATTFAAGGTRVVPEPSGIVMLLGGVPLALALLGLLRGRAASRG